MVSVPRKRATNCACAERRVCLTSHIVEDGLGLGQLGLQLDEARVEELPHAVDLLLHQAAAARRLVSEAHWTHTHSYAQSQQVGDVR